MAAIRKFPVWQPLIFMNRLIPASGLMHTPHFPGRKDMWRSPGAVRSPAATARHRRSSVIACATVQLMPSPNMQTGTSMPGSCRRMRLLTVLMVFIPGGKKLNAFFYRLKHAIYFGTFPSEVRPEFICEESLSLISTVLLQYKTPFRCTIG